MEVKLGRSLDVICRCLQDVRSGRPRDVSSRLPWDGKIESLGDALGTLGEDVLGTTWRPIFAGWVNTKIVSNVVNTQKLNDDLIEHNVYVVINITKKI